MSISIGRHQISDPVLLAPMSGITDAPFRRMVKRFGVGLAFAEMVAGRHVLSGQDRANRMLRHDGSGVQAIQIAGRDPAIMADAARFVVDQGADIVDINMGCPAKQVTGGYAGSALMRDLDQARSIIAAVVAAALRIRGISRDNMKMNGYGEEFLAERTADGVAEAKNRRVEVSVAP